jgi:hypothetical protein
MMPCQSPLGRVASSGRVDSVTEWFRAVWRKSSYCAQNTCVEMAVLDGQVAVRDSKEQHAVLLFTPAEWTAFVAGAKGGEFDRDSRPGEAGWLRPDPLDRPQDPLL